MSLQKQVIELLPVGGVDEGKAKFLPVPFHRLQNLVATKLGQLEKRAGLGVMLNDDTNGGTIGNPSAVFAAGRELVTVGTAEEAATDDPGAYLHSYSTALDQWAPRAPVPQTSTTRYPSARSGAGVGDKPTQVARVGSIECVIYHRNGADTVYYRLVDRATDTVLQSDTSLGDLVKAVLLVVSSKFVVVWRDTATEEVKQTIIDPIALTVSTAVVFTAVGVASTGWDAIATVSGKWVWAGASNAPDLNVRRVNLSPVGVDASYLIVAIEPTRVALGWRSGYSYVLLAYDDPTTTGQVRAEHLIETTLVNALAAWNVIALSTFNGSVIKTLDAQFDDSNRSFIAVGADDLSSRPAWWLRAFSNVGASLMSAWKGYWILQQHKMFRLDGALYVTFSATETDVGKRFGYALVNLSRHFASVGVARPMALEGNLAPYDGLGAAETGLYGYLPAAFVSGDEAHLTLSIGRRELTGETSAWVDVAELRAERRAEGLWSGVYASDLLHLTGSLGVQYDGTDAHEIGFLQAPHPQGSASLSYGATGLEGTAVGGGHVYQWVAIYEWRDAKGMLHRSRVSDAVTATVGTSGGDTHAEVVIQFRHTPLTRRPSDTGSGQLVKILVYRTLKDVPGPFYQCAFTDGFNEPTSSLLTYTDTEDDAALLAAGRGQLYTTGGILDDEPPPPACHAMMAGGRVWLTSAEAREVWPSKTILQGEAPAFSPLLRITFDDAPDRLVGTARCGNAVAIFSESRIYALDASSGPGRIAGVWPQPEMVQSSVGCSSGRSLVSFRDGVMFLSPEGLRLLTPGFDLVAAGEAVRDTLAAYPVVVDAMLDGPRQRLYYLCSTSEVEGGEAVVLVYDYRQRGPDGLGLWTVWTFEGEALERLCLWQEQLAAAHTTAPLLEEGASPTGYDDYGDGAVWVESLIETPWVRLGALGGYQRIWRAVVELERQTSFGFSAEFCVDGDSTAVQTETFTTAQTGNARRQRWVIGVVEQKCQSFKLRITDSGPASPSGVAPAGFIYHGLSLEIGGKFGVEKAEKGKTRLCPSPSSLQAASWPALALPRSTSRARQKAPPKRRRRPTSRPPPTGTTTSMEGPQTQPSNGATSLPHATPRGSTPLTRWQGRARAPAT